MLRIFALVALASTGCNPIVSLDSYCFEADCAGQNEGGAGAGSAGGGADVGYGDVILSHEPKAYFRFDEPAGSTSVVSVVGTFDGVTESSDVTFAVPGALADDPNTAMALDTTGHLLIDAAAFDIDGNDPFTVELWLKMGQGDYLHPFESSESGGGGHMFKLQSGTFTYFRFGETAGPNRYASFSPDDDLWQYIGLSYDGSSATFVVNDQVTTEAFPDSIPAYTGPVKVRSAFGEAPASIDELAIYDSALSSEQLLAHYHCGRDRSTCAVGAP